jgi:hypothetical protein
MKLQLTTVTLMCIDCLNTERAIKVLERCKQKADFGAVKLLTSIPTDYPHAVNITPLHSLVAYSVFMLTRCHEYIDTPHVLIVQRDGWILNPESFDPAWLELDYIGPLFVQYDKVGSGGFSLRSKKIMQHVSEKNLVWDGTQQHAEYIQARVGYYEDGVICLNHGINKGFKIASNEQAAAFGQGGNRNPVYFREKPFGFHRTWQEIDFKTGIVDSSDLSKDLHSTYDHEIDAL